MCDDVANQIHVSENGSKNIIHLQGVISGTLKLSTVI